MKEKRTKSHSLFPTLFLWQVHLCEAEKCPSPERDGEQRVDGDDAVDDNESGGGGRLRVVVRSIWKGASEAER